MKINDPIKGCDYWGYAPASDEYRHAISKLGMERVREIRKQYEQDRQTIKAAGFRPSNMGFKSKVSAIGEASKIERETGVEMYVFSHGYL